MALFFPTRKPSISPTNPPAGNAHLGKTSFPVKKSEEPSRLSAWTPGDLRHTLTRELDKILLDSKEAEAARKIIQEEAGANGHLSIPEANKAIHKVETEGLSVGLDQDKRGKVIDILKRGPNGS